jgi:hypothetical protein
MVEPGRPAGGQESRSWVPRADRLRVGAPVAYRSIYDEGWHAGSTVNISRTGVLFRPTEGDTVSAGDLQLVIYLSRTTLEVAGATPLTHDLYCGGRVARTAEVDGQPAVAVQIEFEWAEAPPGRLWDTGL